MRLLPRFVLVTVLTGVIAAFAADAPVMPRFQDYYFAFLRKGPKWTGVKTPRSDSIQAGHLANIGRMHEAGLLVAAGPFERGQDRRGVFIFRADSIDAIRRMVAQDPAVEAGQLQMDLYRWTAPPGIGELYATRSKEPGHRDSMYALQLAVIRYGPEFKGFSDEATMKDLGAHGARLMELFKAGTVATGGQFHPGSGPDTTLVGVLVFRGDTTATRALVRDDPAVGKRFSVEWEKWWIAWGTLPGDTL
jgi:uncharacterized protein YciI